MAVTDNGPVPVVLQNGKYFLASDFYCSEVYRDMLFDKSTMIVNIDPLLSPMIDDSNEEKPVSAGKLIPFGGTIPIEYISSNRQQGQWHGDMLYRKLRTGGLFLIRGAKRQTKEIGATHFSLEKVAVELVPFKAKGFFKKDIRNSNTRISGLLQRYVEANKS